jgi:hypothetical protein
LENGSDVFISWSEIDDTGIGFGYGLYYNEKYFWLRVKEKELFVYDFLNDFSGFLKVRISGQGGVQFFFTSPVKKRLKVRFVN